MNSEQEKYISLLPKKVIKLDDLSLPLGDEFKKKLALAESVDDLIELICEKEVFGVKDSFIIKLLGAETSNSSQINNDETKKHLLVGYSLMQFHQFGNPVRKIEDVRESFNVDFLSDLEIKMQLDIRTNIRNQYPKEIGELESPSGLLIRELLRKEIGPVNHPIFETLPKDQHPENIIWNEKR